MNTAKNIKTFFQYFNEMLNINDSRTERYQTKIGDNEINFNRSLVQSLCLSKKMKWYGLDMQMSDIEFAVKVYHLFYDDSQLSRIFKKAEDAETDKFERSLRECIQKRIDVEASDWRKYSDKQRKCKKMKIIFNADNNRKLIQLKNEVCPNLEIDAFNGTIDFGIGLPSVDESLPMKKRYAKKRNCDKIDYAAIKRGISQQLLESAMFNANFG